MYVIYHEGKKLYYNSKVWNMKDADSYFGISPQIFRKINRAILAKNARQSRVYMSEDEASKLEALLQESKIFEISIELKPV